MKDTVTVCAWTVTETWLQDALAMNANFLNNADYSGVQSVEAIQGILAAAQVCANVRHIRAIECALVSVS
jgi:hypothetical protein